MQVKITDETTSRVFLYHVATKINKKPADVEKFVEALEGNWIENVGGMKQMDDSQWKELSIPMGLVNKIKENLALVGKEEDEPMQIDSSTGAKAPQKSGLQNQLQQLGAQRQANVPVLKIDLDDSEALNLQKMKASLDLIKKDADSQSHKDSVNTLHKVIENLILKPMDVKVRSLPKTNKGVQNKILAHKGAVQFLECAGFDFGGSQEIIELKKYDQNLLKQAAQAIQEHITELGAQIKQESTFDPTKSFKISNAGEQYCKPKGLSAEEESKYDPTKAINMVDQIKKQRAAQLEGKIADKEIKVFNSNGSASNIKEILANIDQEAQQKMNKMRVNEQQFAVKQEEAAALNFMKDQKKAHTFQNKRDQELQRVMNMPHYTRSNVRVKFADGYVLQGTFGALETIQDVYNFVAENLFFKPDQRTFYLYETPPKKVLEGKLMKQTLNQAKMVPSCMIYMAWKDRDETKAEDGPFLDMKSLQNKIVHA